MELTPADLSALDRCYIDEATARAAGLYRVPSIEGRDLVGRRGGGDYAGLVFEFRLPGSAAVVLHRLRLDNPPLDTNGRPEHKYLSPPGARNHLYFPPCDPALVADGQVPVLIVEGEKKVLAVWRATLEAAAGNGGHPQFLPVGLTGVWNWRGVVGTQTDAQGRRVSVKGTIPDVLRIPWNGRTAYLCFDTNTQTNGMVQAARAALARELIGQGALIQLVDLPPETGINGPDDYLAAHGREAFLQLIADATGYDWRGELARSDKGKILPTFSNALVALRTAQEWHGVLAFNEFSLGIEARQAPPWRGGAPGRWQDDGALRTLEWLEHRGMPIGKHQTHDAVETVAREHSYHPVRDYLNGLKWDGVGRIEGWLTTCLGADGNDYTLAVGRCWLVQAVARIFEPGAKADCVLVLEGPQGIGKSRTFATLGGEFYSDDIAELGTKDASQNVAGVWIMELPELSAMTHSAVEKVKAFLSRQQDHFRPPYGRNPVWVPRQCVFGGSINLGTYLKDETGARRFWPVRCGRINLAALARDRDQLWAEAAARYKKGEPWWLDTQDLIEAANKEQEERYHTDDWEALVEPWLLGQLEVTTADVLEQVIKKDRQQWTRGDTMRVGGILERLGWTVRGRGAQPGRRRVYRK